MGGFYFISFFNLWAAFADRQWCRVIWLIVLSFSFFKGSPTSFLNFLAKNHTRALALGSLPVLVTKLNPRSV